MVDRAPDFAVGDNVLAFEHSVVISFLAKATMTKGDVVGMDTTAVATGDYNGVSLCGVYPATTVAPTAATAALGVVTGTQTNVTTFVSGDYVPVLLFGITKI